MKEGKLNNRCYTTNWDTLTEDAFYWLRGTNCITIKGPDQLREVKDFDHRYVVKLHGDLDRYDIRYLREGMAKHNDDLRDFLRQSLVQRRLGGDGLRRCGVLRDEHADGTGARLS